MFSSRKSIHWLLLLVQVVPTRQDPPELREVDIVDLRATSLFE
jgi:hypothetical protein